MHDPMIDFVVSIRGHCEVLTVPALTAWCGRVGDPLTGLLAEHYVGKRVVDELVANGHQVTPEIQALNEARTQLRERYAA